MPVKEENGKISYRLTRYSYDKRGNCSHEKRYLDYQSKESAAGRVLLIQKTYDRSGRLIQISDSLGSSQEYRYESHNQVVYEKRKIREDVYQEKKYSYTKAGHIESVEVSADAKGCGRYTVKTRFQYNRNGSTQAWIYDKNNRLVQEIGAKEYRRIGFEGRGRVICYENDRIKAVYRMDGSLERAYAYDEYGQMTHQIEGSGAEIRLEYELSGRRTYAATDNGAAQTWDYDPWGNISHVIDGNGNTTGFYYDGWGKVTRIDRADGAVENYVYDAAGNLTESVDGNGGNTIPV